MSENKTLVLQITHDDKGRMAINFGTGISFTLISHALRLANIHFDNMIIGNEIKQQAKESKIVQPTNGMINRIRDGK